MTGDEMETFLREWAGRNRCYFEPEGQCGFGRECVGLVHNNHYPDYSDCPEAGPPDSVQDAYHKDDCLAVLGRGPRAIEQLYQWVKHLEANNVVVVVRERTPENVFDLALHGTSAPVLEVAS